MNDEQGPVTRGDPSQLLDVLRDVLRQHMDKGLPDYQVQSAVYIGRHSGRLISNNDIIEGRDVPAGLRLTMRSGAEYDLTLAFAEKGADADDDQ